MRHDRRTSVWYRRAPPRAAALHLMARAPLMQRSRRYSMRSFRVVLLFGCFLLPFAAQAQFQEQISVEVVDVPVYVFGPQGPLTNLTRGDFDLFVNGKR